MWRKKKISTVYGFHLRQTMRGESERESEKETAELD